MFHIITSVELDILYYQFYRRLVKRAHCFSVSFLTSGKNTANLIEQVPQAFGGTIVCQVVIRAINEKGHEKNPKLPQ
jgi:hypothetical protein